MQRHRLWIVLLALAPLAPLAAQVAEPEDRCVDEPARIVELELDGCRPAEIALEEQMAGTTVWWLRPYMLSIAEANPGVMLRGRVWRSRVFDLPQTFGPWTDDGNEEEFFYTSTDGRLCEAFAGVEDSLFLAEPPCCDVIPPVSVACLLQTQELRPVLPHLIDVMDQIEELADGEDDD